MGTWRAGVRAEAAEGVWCEVPEPKMPHRASTPRRIRLGLLVDKEQAGGDRNSLLFFLARSQYKEALWDELRRRGRECIV